MGSLCQRSAWFTRAVVQLHGGVVLFGGEFQCQGAPGLEPGGRRVTSGDSGPLRSAESLGDGACDRPASLRGLGGVQLCRDGGDIGVDIRQAVGPVAAQLARFAHRDVGHVDALGAGGDSGPRLARRAVGLQRLFERGAIAGPVEDAVQNAGAELGAEEAAQVRRHGDVDGQPAVLRPVLLRGRRSPPRARASDAVAAAA